MRASGTGLALLLLNAGGTHGSPAARAARGMLAPETLDALVQAKKQSWTTEQLVQVLSTHKMGSSVQTKEDAAPVVYPVIPDWCAPGGGYCQVNKPNSTYPSMYDTSGRECTACLVPSSAEVGYGGVAINSSTITKQQWADGKPISVAPDYIVRDDCIEATDPTEFLLRRLSKQTYKYSGAQADLYPGYTNGWCYFGLQTTVAYGFANRDNRWQGKSIDLRGDNAPFVTCANSGSCTYDYHYCKYNGFLNVTTRTKVSEGFESVNAYARDFCAWKEAQGYDLDGMIGLQMLNANTVDEDSPMHAPTKDQAEFIGAWLCSMGGLDGHGGKHSEGPAGDMSYCAYTYGDMNPTHPGEFCMYDECDGWDPLTGLPISEYHTASGSYTGTMDLQYTQPLPS